MNQSWVIDTSGVMPAAVATGLFRSLCTIQAPSGVLGPSGAPEGAYADVSGLVGIVCQDAPQPPSEIKLGANERRAPSEVTDMAIRHVLLNSFYPSIADGWRAGWRAVISTNDSSVDPIIYDIAGVESDSQRRMTRLELHLASAGDVFPVPIGAVLAINFEGSATGFIVGIAQTQLVVGSGFGLTINILEVGPSGEILDYVIGVVGENYLVNDTGLILTNASGDSEPFIVTVVS